MSGLPAQGQPELEPESPLVPPPLPLSGPIPQPPAPSLTVIQARNLARWNLKYGNIRFPDHAYVRMDAQKPPLTVEAVHSVIHAGQYLAPEIQSCEWRYKVATRKIWVVLAFDDVRHAVVCTAHRFATGRRR